MPESARASSQDAILGMPPKSRICNRWFGRRGIQSGHWLSGYLRSHGYESYVRVCDGTRSGGWSWDYLQRHGDAPDSLLRRCSLRTLVFGLPHSYGYAPYVSPAPALSQDMDYWNISQVTGVSSILIGATAIHHNVCCWTAPQALGAAALTQGIGSWDTLQ